MPYTLLKFLGWGIAFFAVGVFVGWSLRSLKARADIAAVRRSTVDDEPGRGAENEADDSGPGDSEPDDSEEADGEANDQPGGSDEADQGETGEQPGGSDKADQGETGEQRGNSGEADSEADSEANDGEADARATDDVQHEALDLDAASVILGSVVELDDLTTVEGIGPKIAELCAGIGITTWGDLAGTEVATLRSMLDDAGSRYKVHDPTSWPEQAALLAEGRWADFAQLVDESSSGQ